MIKAIAFDYDGVIKLNDADFVSSACKYLEINKEDWLKEYFILENLIISNQKSVEDVVSIIASKFNLEMLTRSNNSRKSGKCSLRIDILQEMYYAQFL